GIMGTQMHVRIDGEEEGEHHHHHDHEHSHEHHHHDHDHEHHHHHDHEPHHHDHEPHHHDHDHEHEHHHSHPHVHHGMHEIGQIVEDLMVSEQVKKDVLAVYQLIAEAESKAHNKPVTEIHFHEVGNLDAIADITAVCMLMEELKPEKVMVSPIHVGSGHVHCAHGILPVPAPATAHILQGVPIYGGKIRGELCTPTGAALLKHFADKFGEMPVMEISAVGYGMGKKDFEAINCVRAMIGNIQDETEYIYELQCNIDDMSAEELGYAMDMLFEAGAVDVYTTTIGMKKNRPGVLLSLLCREEEKEDLVKAMFKYTSTIGIREKKMPRYTLKRQVEELQTIHGSVRLKTSTGYGVTRSKYEYEDLARIAKEEGRSIREVVELLENSGE
ncbi:MAG: nickel pincer cofactor biosynthesis protein LarC, partial [Dorea sp.]|nr:nickel pincer cofactor biosynthesis protein LarC [Dorea sp.]